jgi:2-dehydropantoate 2-reductase
VDALRIRSVAVLGGAGGVGGFVAAALARAGSDVRIVVREDTAEVVQRQGLRVRSAILGEFVAHPGVVWSLDEEVDALLVATKAIGLRGAVARVTTAPPVVVPLLNGLDHLELLRDRFGAEAVAAGVIRIESDRPQPGVIVQTSPSCRIDVASRYAAAAPALEALATTLGHADIPVAIGDSEARVMWSKLARLCPLALTTSAADRPLGFIRSDPRWRSALQGAVTETVAVANAEGAELQEADTLAELEAAHAELGSSMQRDITAGREPELDAIAGAVLRAGIRRGRRCPTVDWLAGRVAARAGLAWSGP